MSTFMDEKVLYILSNKYLGTPCCSSLVRAWSYALMPSTGATFSSKMGWVCTDLKGA